MRVNGSRGQSETDRVRAARLAQNAFRYGLHENWANAAILVQRINDECDDPAALPLAIMAWADTFIDHCTGGVKLSPEALKSIDYGFINTDTGALTSGAEDTPAAVQWAGQVIRARAAMDAHEFRHLLESVPTDDPAAAGRYVLAVLSITARTVNGLPRGYLLMGAEEERG